MKSAAPITGSVPIRTEVFDPRGNETRYGGIGIMQNNRFAITIPFAGNDLVGTWRIRVTELVSGKYSEAMLELK